MASVNIPIDQNGNAQTTHVNGGDSVTWTLSSSATQSFSVDPPANLFVQNPSCFTLTAGQTSGSSTVKTNAGLGNHGYDVKAGDCTGESVGTGAAMIIVDTGTSYAKP